MHVLALDTTTRDGSVALADEHHVIEERRGDAAQSQAERLPAELIRLLSTRGLSVSGVDLFAVAAGPGSFTGMRIGIATIQGLALTTGKPVVAVSALEALAQIAGRVPGALVAAWMDARRHDVFAALYRIVDAPLFSPERLVEVEGTTVGDPEAILERWGRHLRDASVTFVGDGAALNVDALVNHRSVGWEVLKEPPLLAGAIGRMAIARAQRGDIVHPAAVHPLYVRRPDVEVERERRAGQHKGDKGH